MAHDGQTERDDAAGAAGGRRRRASVSAKDVLEAAKISLGTDRPVEEALAWAGRGLVHAGALLWAVGETIAQAAVEASESPAERPEEAPRPSVRRQGATARPAKPAPAARAAAEKRRGKVSKS